ncbi:Hint domain N-terminal [uncultured Caudovirales phage]|uniref:Hint domain N-terminal n=1 Tax=uncultured Caudovirales phage TaxID=2100421 RepID=A0A6J5L1W3_9CAUD|nr:Hint domain N-terminal [uncultured Caudovirales phage]
MAPALDFDQLPESVKRKLLFTRCTSKDMLHLWIKQFLHLDMPDTIVDDLSTSSPMDLIWEIYSKGMNPDSLDFSRMLAYASRDSFKTLGAAIIEVLSLIHMERDCAHMAAIESQAKKSQSYVKGFFNKPIIREFLIGDNDRRKEFVRYTDDATGDTVTQKEYDKLNQVDRKRYKEHRNYITIVICTLAGANCVDPASLVTMAEGGKAHAFVLQPGDLVKNINLKTKAWGVGKVKRVSQTAKWCVRLHLDNGATLVVSDDHPALTDSGFVRAGAVSVGMRTLCVDEDVEWRESYQPLVDVEELPRRQELSELIDTRCFECGTPLPFFVNGRPSFCEKCYGHKPDLKFLADFSHTILKVEDAGFRNLIDIEIDTEEEQEKNFIANGYVVHNSEHVPLLVVDEVDVISNPAAYTEAKMIPAPKGRHNPITLLTSTRKFSFGLVQQEIDNAAKSGLEIRHWNIIDVTEKCPETRCLKSLPMIDVHYSDELLETITPDEFKELGTEQQKKYAADKAYQGCLKNCHMFAMCRGKLATKQKEVNHNAKVKSMLKPVSHTQNLFKEVDLATAQSQLLCKKATTSGLIYPNFDREIHLVTASQIAEMITGEVHNEKMTKRELVHLMKEKGIRFVAGMDFGYTHNFSVTLGAVQGNRAFVLDLISQAELELEAQIDLCNAKIRHYDPKVYADPENPQNIVTFRKKGYKIHKVEKGHGSVLGGIEIVRQALRPAMGPPRLYFLRGDDGVEFLAKRLSQYHWKLDAAGEPTDIPEDKNDDEADSLRYLVMSIFGKSGRLTIEGGAPTKESTKFGAQPVNGMSWINSRLEGVGLDPIVDDRAARGHTGGFLWDF